LRPARPILVPLQQRVAAVLRQPKNADRRIERIATAVSTKKAALVEQLIDVNQIAVGSGSEVHDLDLTAVAKAGRHQVEIAPQTANHRADATVLLQHLEGIVAVT